MSKQFYKDLQFQMARAVGLQKSLKKQRTEVNRSISGVYDRMKRNGFQDAEDGRTYVPERCALELPGLIRRLSQIEKRIKRNSRTIWFIDAEITDLKFRHAAARSVSK